VLGPGRVPVETSLVIAKVPVSFSPRQPLILNPAGSREHVAGCESIRGIANMKSKREANEAQDQEHKGAPSEKARLQPADAPSYQEIQRRAYEIHVERGGTHGQDVDDWLQAERELKEKHRIAG